MKELTGAQAATLAAAQQQNPETQKVVNIQEGGGATVYPNHLHRWALCLTWDMSDMDVCIYNKTRSADPQSDKK